MTGTELRLAPFPVELWDDDTLDALERGRSSLLSDELQDALDSREPARLAGVLPNAITTLLHSPSLAGAWLAFNGALLRDLTLPPRSRELLVLRVAWRTRSTYEWLQHVRMAPRFGISEDEVQAIATDGSAGAWAPNEAVLIAAADQLVENHTLDDATWSTLSDYLDERQLVEVPFVVGAYATLAMAFNAFAVKPDPQYQAVSAPAIPHPEV